MTTISIPYTFLKLNGTLDSLTEAKILGFRNFKKGWHYHGGVPFKDDIIFTAIKINRKLLRCGFEKTNAFPGLDGEIMVTAYHKEHYFEFAIEKDQSITYCREMGDEELAYEEGYSYQEIISMIDELAEELCLQYGSLADNITSITISAESIAWPSKILATTPESRSLTRNVFTRLGILYANTSENITLRQQVGSLLFSGSSPQRYYP